MSCSRDRIKDLLFAEPGETGSAELRAHVETCAECREEYERLRLTTAALRSVAEEEPPRRVAFVSDKIFEPRWWQRMWQPAWAAAAIVLLAGAIVFHALTRPAPAPVASFDAAAFEQRVRAEVAKAVADTEARQEKKTAELVEAARKEFEFQRQADRVAFEETLTLLQKKYNVLYTASVDRNGGRP